MYLAHCLGPGVDGLFIFTSHALEDPRLQRSCDFIDISRYSGSQRGGPWSPGALKISAVEPGARSFY